MKKQVEKAMSSFIYPEKAYIAYILVIHHKSSRFFLPFNEIFTNLNQVRSYSKIYIEKSSDKNTMILPAPIIFPVSLAEKIPLQKKYWDSPTEELTRTDRINNFLKPLENHRFQKLLVTPFKNKGETLPTATYCFGIQAKPAEIDFFLSNFYLSLDEKARFAAIYHFDTPFRFELDTEEKIAITDSPSSVIH